MFYEKLYYSIIERRKTDVPVGYSERHHIIPRSLGGSNNKANVVRLTAKEHFICHLLLTKMYPNGSKEHTKMCYAFMMMQVQSPNHAGNRYNSGRSYEYLRIEFYKRTAASRTGQNNSQFGTKWIHNKVLNKAKKVPALDLLEVGWEEGRSCSPLRCCKACNVPLKRSNRQYCDVCRAEKRYIQPVRQSKKYTNGYRVSIDGVEYKSISQAADILGIGHETVRLRLNSKNFPSYLLLTSK